MTEMPESTESALALIEYPSRFPLKVFGQQSDDL
jgi:putative lipoic acid-binding regulatory protein